MSEESTSAACCMEEAVVALSETLNDVLLYQKVGFVAVVVCPLLTLCPGDTLKINEGKVVIVNEAIDISTFVHDVARSFGTTFLTRQL